MFISDQFDKKLFNIAVEKYIKHKNSQIYEETYKFDIIDDLNNELDINKVNKNNILQVVSKLQKNNPSSGSFVHWSDLANLNEFAEKEPEVVNELIHNLFSEEEKLAIRINTFRRVGKEYFPDISLGTPLFGYILAAFDKNKYTLYKDEILKDFVKLFVLKKPTNIGEKYEFYLMLCRQLYKKLDELDIIEELELMHSQDFIYCISQVPELRFDLLLKFIYKIALQLKEYKKNTKKIINDITTLDTDYFKKIRDKFRNSDKIKNIQYEIINEVIKKGRISKNEIINIKGKVVGEHDKDILHSWNDFNILFQIYYFKIKQRVSYILSEIYKLLLNNINTKISSDEIGKEGAIKGFDWNQDSGSDRCWIAICPKYKKSCKDSGQLYLSISGEGIKYGLNTGLNINSKTLNNLETEKEPEQLNLGKIINKYDEVYEDYLKINEDIDNELAKPLADFFANWDEADWAFDFLADICGKLGVEDDSDRRINISYSSRKIHFSFTNWLIAGFYTYIDEMVIPLFKEKGSKFGKLNSEFTTDENEIDVALFYVDVNEIKEKNSDLYVLFSNTLDYIKKLKKNYKSSPYRFSNKKQLSKSIFTLDKRVELFEKGLKFSKKYYWLTSHFKELKLDNLEEGDIVEFNAINQNNKRRGSNKKIRKAIESINKNDIIVGYHSRKSKNGVWVLLEAQESLYNEKIKMKVLESLKEPVKKELIDNELEEEINLRGKTILEIPEKTFQIVEKLIHESTIEPPEVNVNFNLNLEINNLYFPEVEKNQLIKRITTNLKNGKHIILTGPPGTGKSKLAKEIVNQYVGDRYKMVTARSDWSTFDTIGGYRPEKNGKLNFNSGVFLECFKSSTKPDNKWLIIDEINRADIDKAFGSLFSALTGDAVSLSFKNKEDRNIKLLPQQGNVILDKDNIYIIPDDWRIIATMNTYDKTSLYEMSYAFMRRFAFIPVSIPTRIDEKLVREYIKCWDINNYNYIEAVAQLWNFINKVRKIGPAIIEDIYRYLLENENDYDSIIISYVLPQFEGVRNESINNFMQDLKNLKFIKKRDVSSIKNFAEDYFRMGVQ